MTKRNRNILFFFLFILFFILTPIIILYSLGYRIDFRTKKIVQPGILFLKVWPKNVEIYLNKKLEKKTDIFFGTALIKDLTPKKYEVEIKKDNFQTWKKELEIKKGLATEAKNILLVPQKINFTSLGKNTEDFFLSPDGKILITKELTNNDDNSKNESNNDWSLKIFELNKNIKSHLFEKKQISKEEFEISFLKFSPDNKKILLKTKIFLKDKNKSLSNDAKKDSSYAYYIIDIEKTPFSINRLNIKNYNIEDIYFNPQNYQEIFFLNENKLYKIDILKNLSLELLLDDIISFSVDNDNVYYLDKNGFIFKTNGSLSFKDKLNTSNLLIKNETNYKIIALNSHIFVKENNLLYKINETGELEKIFEPINNLKFSYDLKKAVFFNNYEAWVIFLQDIFEQPFRKANEKIFIARFSENIDDIFWLTNHYLIFNFKNAIKIAEIDNRDKINIFDTNIPNNFEISKTIWNSYNKTLLILLSKELYQSEKLTP